jgi:esterase
MGRRPQSVDQQLDHLRLAAEIADIEVDSIVLPEERELVVRGLTLHYLDWGTCARPPILFLHGGNLTAHTWDLVCLQLRRSYRCLALDQRGHGESAWHPDGDYGTEAYVADIDTIQGDNPRALSDAVEGYLDALGSTVDPPSSQPQS